MPQSAIATAQFSVEQPCKQTGSGEDLAHLMPFYVWVELPGFPNAQTGHKCEAHTLYTVSEDPAEVGRRLLGYWRTTRRGVVCACMGRVIE